MSGMPNKMTKEELIDGIISTYLHGAPEHIERPQRTELSSFNCDQLILIGRLLKRRSVSAAINDAKEKGLYEVAEHLSGSFIG